MNPTFPELVHKSVTSQHINYAPISTMHEAYGLILEELDEFWDLVRLKDGQAKPEDILGELVDIAAVTQKIAEDFELTSALNVGTEQLDLVEKLRSRITSLEEHLLYLKMWFIGSQRSVASPVQKNAKVVMVPFDDAIINGIDEVLDA